MESHATYASRRARGEQDDRLRGHLFAIAQLALAQGGVVAGRDWSVHFLVNENEKTAQRLARTERRTVRAAVHSDTTSMLKKKPHGRSGSARKQIEPLSR